MQAIWFIWEIIFWRSQYVSFITNLKSRLVTQICNLRVFFKYFCIETMIFILKFSRILYTRKVKILASCLKLVAWKVFSNVMLLLEIPLKVKIFISHIIAATFFFDKVLFKKLSKVLREYITRFFLWRVLYTNKHVLLFSLAPLILVE